MPKFQAIQAAHEILGDAGQKDKYDAERAKINNRAREVESPTFKKPPPPRRTDSGFPPNSAYAQTRSAPRRDTSETRYAPQNAPRQRPQSANVSAGDKFAQFARAAPPPQTWDKARFESEGLRGMNAMRGGHMPQVSPMRSHPTAPKPNDPYMSGGEPSPGFPGLNRTGSQRRAYPPNSSGMDEPRSAYSRYNRADPRPPSTGPYQTPHSQSRRDQESTSPLRATRSSNPSDFKNVRPGLSRTSSRYAHTGGERMDPNATNIGRSASVRQSPVDREHGPFGNTRTPEERSPRPRHRSHSPPTGKPRQPHFQYASESSSSEDEETPPPQDRRKVPLRRTQPRETVEDPGLTGYFPKHNYTRIVDDENTYEYPAPDAKDGPTRKPFSTFSPLDTHDPNANEPPFRTPSQEDLNKPKYATPSQLPYIRRVWPSWALPSSICPRKSSFDDRSRVVPETPDTSNSLDAPFEEPPRGFTFSANSLHSTDGDSPSKHRNQSAFSAEEWLEHFDNHADMFNPADIPSRDRQSPSKNNRARAGPSRAYAQTKEKRRDTKDAEIDPTIAAGVRHVDGIQTSSKTNAFQPPKLAPDFVNQVNAGRRNAQADQQGGSFNGNGHTNGNRAASDEMDLDSPSTDSVSPGAVPESYNVSVEEEHSPTEKPHSPAQNRHTSDAGTRVNGFSMNDLKQSGPFAPSQTGLKDLNDLTNNLPFKSRPAENVDVLHRTTSTALRELNLPRPPKPPHCPADSEITSRSWLDFADSMTTYMHDWNRFNAAMVEHFRLRQEAVTHGMYRNWVMAWGDGATAEDFEASHGSDRAGYATYMTWLDDDKKCRAWWDVAFEEHIRCMEGLGRVRKCVKALNAEKEG